MEEKCSDAAGRRQVADSQGNVIADATGKGAGYRYFGAAKQLPGVKELFDKEKPRQVCERIPSPPWALLLRWRRMLMNHLNPSQ